MATPTLATYGGATQVAGFAGGIAETGPNVIRSFLNTSATAIDLGVAVGRGAATAAGATDKCIPVTAGTEVIIGISVRNAGNLIASTDGVNTINYPQYAAVPVLTDGVVFVTTAEAVAEGDTVLFVVASNKFGSVATGALAGTTRVAVPGSIWLDTASSGGIARIRIKNSTT